MAISEEIKRPEESRRATLRERVYTIITLVIVLICFAVLMIHPFVKINGGDLTSFDVNANIGWKYEDGSEADLTKLMFTDGKGTIKRDITSVFTAGKDFCFETSYLLFRVYLDDQMIYEFSPDIPAYYGKYYGDYTHFVNIPYFKGTGHLRIEYEALAENNRSNFRNARMTEGNDYMRSGVGAGIFEFALCFSTCIIGIIIIIMGLIFHTRRNGMIETVSLGTISILVACFLMSSTKIWQLLFMDSAMPRLTEFIALALIPIPVTLFAEAYSDSLEKKFAPVICGTSFIMFILIWGFMFTGYRDYSALLIPMLVVILISMILLIAAFISSRHKKEVNLRRHLSLIIAFLILMITGSMDTFLYYFHKENYTVQTVIYGLGVFTCMLMIYETNNIIAINKKNVEADAMYRLARVDGLTGLANRLAFDEAEKEMESDEGSVASFTLLDINDLKLVNDQYGHSEGDRHIRSAADIIASSFGKYGQCFRIGGDEFFTIIKGEGHHSKVIEAVSEMTAQIERYNREEKPPVPLRIACGTASYENGLNTVSESEKLADSRMYDQKKLIKESSGSSK